MKRPAETVKAVVESFTGFLGQFTECAQDLLELKLYLRALQELRNAHQMFLPFKGKRKISIFGSARTAQTHPSYQQAARLAELMTLNDWFTITGAGPGIMEAGHAGTTPERRIGLNIALPFEQGANSFIEAISTQLATMRFFFTRKLMFIAKSDAIAAFNGGFGTFDELFEALTLVQTGKSPIVPICWIDHPGDDYFKDLDLFVRKQLLGKGMISDHDSSLYFLTEDVEQAAQHILDFYRVYHSMYYVRDLTVLRLNSQITPEKLDIINQRFSSMLTGGVIDQVQDPAQEHYKPCMAQNPRLIMRFNRRAYGKLRQLIDLVNAS